MHSRRRVYRESSWGFVLITGAGCSSVVIHWAMAKIRKRRVTGLRLEELLSESIVSSVSLSHSSQLLTSLRQWFFVVVVVWVHTHTYTHTCTHILVYTCIHTHTHNPRPTPPHTHLHVYTHIYNIYMHAERERERERDVCTQRLRQWVSWCFEPSQPLGFITGLSTERERHRHTHTHTHIHKLLISYVWYEYRGNILEKHRLLLREV